ncbi:molybdate ABC transporter substrate-binding protein [Persephonella sp.]
MKNLVFWLLFLFAGGAFGETLFVAASANVQYVLKELISDFGKKSGCEGVKTVVASSGKLTAQIERGAPYHIFLSADMKYPLYLYRKGFTVEKPRVYAIGVLVIWSMKGIPLREKGPMVLLSDDVKRIAMPNPRNAPYGRAAREYLSRTGLFDKVRKKIIYGESVSQTSQYIFKKLVDVGFTAKSVVLSPRMKGKGTWIEVDRSKYSPIKQGVVLLKKGEKNRCAAGFYRYLFTSDAKKILSRFGYITDEQN